MKKLSTLAALTLLALTGCNTPNHIEGTLALSSAINVNAKKLLGGGTTSKTVAAGSYKTSLALQQSGAEVRINTKDGVVTFSVPTAAANALGNVNASAAQLGQEFSLAGKLFDTREDINRVISESCVHHYETQNVCNWDNCCDKDGNNCHQEYKCEDVQVPVYGSENVHQVGYQDTKNATINLVKSGKTVGRYSGSYTYKEDIQSSEVVSACAL